jgi:hypothetical protein
VKNTEARQIAEYAKDIVTAPDHDFAILARAYLALEARCPRQREAIEESIKLLNLREPINPWQNLSAALDNGG